MTTRRTLLGLAGLAGASALVGCSTDPEINPALGPPAGAGERDEITFGIWDKAQEPAVLQVIEAFNEQYPGISVTISTTVFGPYFERLRIQATGDDLPDVFWTNGPDFELYASHGMLQDLSELEGFDPANYPENLIELYTYDGVPYAIPKDFDTVALWFNRELLHRAGVDEPTASWSWEEYRDASETVTRALGDEQIWGNAGGVANQALIYPLILQARGFVISEDKSTSGYDSPEALTAFTFLGDMIRDGTAPDVRYTAENEPKDLGWLNTVAGIAAPGILSAFGTFLMRQHFLGMPRSLEETARLDGANPWQTFWRIMFPLSGPALSAVAILTALASWNDLMWPLVVATYDDRTTLAVGLSSLQGQFTTDYPVMVAASFMAMLPLMILFIVLQRRVIEGLAHSGMTG